MVRWLRWHCPPDTAFEFRALAVWGRARYLSVTEAPRNTDFHTWMGKKHFCFFKPPSPGTEPRTLAWKAAVLTTTLGPPPRRLKYSMLPIPYWPGSIFFSNRKWLRHTNHNTTHNIHTRPFCARCGLYSGRCAKTTATTLILLVLACRQLWKKAEHNFIGQLKTLLNLPSHERWCLHLFFRDTVDSLANK